MEKQKQLSFIIDFDSTFITSEGLDELAKISLVNHLEKEERITKISTLTKEGMEGKIPFAQSLEERIALLETNKTFIEKAGKHLAKNISASILRNKAFFQKHKEHIYIVSGGFKELIKPVVLSFGIKENHIFANTFLFDDRGNVIGIDTNNPMSKNNGKVTVVKSLSLEGDIIMIGDGYTDYELKKYGHVKKFVAFTENIEREIVVKKADHVAPTFDEFLYINQLPRSISYPKNRLKVLMVENINNLAVSMFEKEGYPVEYHTKALAREELAKKIVEYSLLCIRSRTKLDKELLQKANKTLAIGSYIIGTDNVDLSAAAEEGIALFNAPYSSTRSVAELVIGNMIALNRKTFEKSHELHNGIWNKTPIGAYEIKGKSLWIIGYGNIGSQVGILAESLGMHVYFYDKVEKPILGNVKKCKTMQELLKKADIVSVHVDGKSFNHDLIGEKEFKLMKDDSLFINASRGFVVDIQALAKALRNKKLRGAAIDVFPQEPKSKDEPFVSALQQIPNVILTPHIGASTVEAQRNIAEYVTTKLIEYINTGNTFLSPNMPNIQLPEQRNSHRLLHMHKNVPGIIAQINNTMANTKINIIGQYLKTYENVGYVITDVNKKYDQKVLNDLKKIPNTIRFRVLY